MKVHQFSAALVALLASAAITACQTTGETAAVQPPLPSYTQLPPFEQEDAAVLEDAVAGLKISAIVGQKVKKTEKVIVVSMEDTKSPTQSAFNYLVDDHLIANLVTDGYVVLERDENLVVRSIPEQASNYQRPLLRQLPSPPGVVLMDGIEKQGLTYIFKDQKIDPADVVALYKQLKDDYQALEAAFNHMEAADAIVSYRLLEMGVRTEVEKKQAPETAEMKSQGGYPDTPWTWNVKRDSLVRLFMRVMDAKTGEIRSAGILQNHVTEEPVRLVQTADEDDQQFGDRANAYVLALEQYHYSWFEQQLPNKAGNPERAKAP